MAESLVLLVLLGVAWLLANRLGLLDAAAAVINDGATMATNSSTVARVKSDVKRDKYLANEKVDLRRRVQAELNLKRHLKYANMGIEDLEAEMERMTQTERTTQEAN